MFLEEQKRREVGRARGIVEWLEMALIAIAANAEHLPCLFAWPCSKKARREYSVCFDEETSIASSGADHTGIAYSALNTSTDKRPDPMIKHFRLCYLLDHVMHSLARAGYETVAILLPNSKETREAHFDCRMR